jgi:hypothetical protein
MEQKGVIKAIGQTKVISDKFKKRDLIIEVADGNWTNVFPVEFVNDKGDQLNGFKIGDEVVVNFNLKGREVKDKENNPRYFVTLDGWKIKQFN